MLLELKNIHKYFDGNVHALQGINLQVKKGEILGIIGPSGAGKSTIVRTMNLLETPNEGEVIYNGVDLTRIGSRELMRIRKKMAMIFQSFNLLNQRTVLQNILFPLEINGIKGKKAEEKALEVLNRVGLSEKKDSYPSQLSGGQKQRVAIARALAFEPEIILCDEATSALDPETTNIVLDLLKGINRDYGITMVVVTHEMNVVDKICHQVAIVDRGVVVEHGVTKDIFKSPKTPTARKLMLLQSDTPIGFGEFEGDKLIRITFGEAACEPIIAGMVLESKLPVNIMFANTRYIRGKALGQMIIKLPKDGWEKHTRYLADRGIEFEDFTGDLEQPTGGSYE